MTSNHEDHRLTVAVIDDHQVLTDALGLVFSKSDLHYLGAADTCAAARLLVAQKTPDVLLLDVDLPDGDGLDLVTELKAASPETQILVFTSYADEDTLMRAVEIGVSGFVSKTQSIPEMLKAVQLAGEGEIVMPASLMRGMLARIRQSQHPDKSSLKPLTPRELEILRLMVQGRSTQALAEALTISAPTVRTHIRNLMSKLNAHSRLEAVSIAMQRGLIETLW
jgi:DNA-binding NarL/FixJ family response regulator